MYTQSGMVGGDKGGGGVCACHLPEFPIGLVDLDLAIAISTDRSAQADL